MEKKLIENPAFEMFRSPSDSLIEIMKKYPSDENLGIYVGKLKKIYVNGHSLINTTWLIRSDWFATHGYKLSYNWPPEEEKTAFNPEHQQVIYHWLRSNGYGLHTKLCSFIFARVGNEFPKEEIIEWCKLNDVNVKDSHIYEVIGNTYDGNILEMFNYLYSEGCVIDPYFVSTIDGNKFNEELVNWLIEHGCDLPELLRSLIHAKKDKLFKQYYKGEGNYDYCCNMIHMNSIDLLKWFSENGGKLDEECVLSAASEGRLTILKWLIDVMKLKYEDKYDLTEKAIYSGRRDILEYLDGEDMLDKSDLNNVLHAEVGCNVEIYDWLFKHGFVPYDYLIVTHLSTMDIDEIKWLIEHGCDIKECEIESQLVYSQNIELLDWLNKRGHRFDASIIGFCVENKLTEALEWFKTIA